ncbi:FAD-binding protein [Thermophilibacter provencensis]|uniref:L-aspartate oxidase n=1 Tax=Thermophilibacter provencensis TaxID=1852386 RepID=A0ABT7V3M7_9ACTN|nr:FAD-binding protein [Thermophilibacter provencensis]MDM8270606.1 FAD-binding protein [Thermophilibacter provencensis]
MACEKAAPSCDVLVVGAGIAGCEAALAAAESGARVLLASAGKTFSGSSFFPGTWGLGLVGPNGEKDEDDFVKTILEVGRGMAVPELARALVRGVAPAISRLEERGVELRGADNPDERDFIPCFDRTCRRWHGLGRESYRSATEAALARAGVTTLPRHELLDLVEEDGRVCGAVLSSLSDGTARVMSAGAVILATGGFGGLFSRTLIMPDVTGTAAAVALRHGARLINIEFIQIMPGLVEPVRNVVFNERTFRYAHVEGFDAPDAAELLDSRGGHGPFTASLPDCVVDLSLAAAGERGAAVSYDLPGHLPEFMQTYFSWFEDAFGRRPDEGLRIAPYAHASNGGILVDEHGFTGVPGLYACGEATGGMHGADRIGGLSSANGLVFGHAAGRAAAASRPTRDEKGLSLFNAWKMDLRELRSAMDEHCLLGRTKDGLREMSRVLNTLDEKNARVKSAHAANSILSARALVAAMLARTESRGAHYRADFPHEDPAQARPLVVRLGKDGRPVAEPLATSLA